MAENILLKHATNQISYYVDDLESFALMHNALFGSGPFFYNDPNTNTVNYRGKEITLTMQQAFGQYGDLQIELVKVHSEDNPYLELGRTGFHHFSNWVEDFDGAIEHFAKLGIEPLFTFESGGGLRVAYMDTFEQLGHYLEMHAPIERFWNMIADASKDWDGTNPYRKFGS